MAFVLDCGIYRYTILRIFFNAKRRKNVCCTKGHFRTCVILIYRVCLTLVCSLLLCFCSYFCPSVCLYLSPATLYCVN